MPKTPGKKSASSRSTTKKAAPKKDVFSFRDPEAAAEKLKPLVHVFEVGESGTQVVCDTDKVGRKSPRGRSVLELRVDSSEGFIPLWSKNTTLRWRFDDVSIQYFENPAAARTEIKKLLGEALLAWGDAVPVKFAERADAWDFEIIVSATDKCTATGCVLASAFFPDAGRHKLRLYPALFRQPREEQVETLVHEIGHVFGLRHFFAKIRESWAASKLFGAENEFSIMNYGPKSKLTDTDRTDLKTIYMLAWNGELKEINGTEIKFMNSYHVSGNSAEAVTSVTSVNPAFQPRT